MSDPSHGRGPSHASGAGQASDPVGAGHAAETGQPRQTQRLALVGFGSVARALLRLLEQTSEELARERGLVFIPTLVATRRGGVLVRPEGLSVDGLLAGELWAAQTSDSGRSDSGGGGWGSQTADLPAILADPATPYDILVEASTASPADGEPAATHLRAALGSGRDAVTANKGPIAWRGPELAALARTRGVTLRYEAATMDCLPVHAVREHIVPVGRVLSFAGIVNSTTNLILTAMAAGEGAAAALGEAQRLGIAEADPRHDTQGHDAALKATILANLLLEPQDPLTPEQVERQGLEAVPPDWPARAAAAGARVRLVARGWRRGPGGRMAAARVAPEELPVDHPLAMVSGLSMALVLQTQHAGKLHLALLEPHLEQTAYALLMDLLAIAQRRAPA
jgi:homoserine dehydrogenase